MRKIKLLLLAVFALVGMGAFAQAPVDKSIGYLYDAAGKKFINAEGKVGVTGMPFKALKQSGEYGTHDGTNRTLPYFRFKTTDEALGLGMDNTNNTTLTTNGIVTASGKYGYGKFAVAAVDGQGFRIMSTYDRADFNVGFLFDYCLGYKADGTLFCFPEAEAPVWQLVDEATYKTLVAANVMPNVNDVGYLYNLATKQFITADATVGESGMEFSISEKVACGAHFGSEGKYIEEAGYNYLRFKKSDGSNNFMRLVNEGVVCTNSGYHKWATIGTEKGLVIRCIYTTSQVGFAQQGYYLTPTAEGKLTLLETPTDASYWQYMSKADYEALKPVVKQFPDEGVEGYLYNPASGKFITKDAHLGVVGDKVTVVAAGTSGDFVNIRYKFSEGNQLNFNGETGMSGTGTSYSKFSVKVTDKGIIMTHAYPNPDNPAWMKAQELGGTYMIADGNELGFKKLEEMGDYGYWQFVDEETYQTLVSSKVYYLKNYKSGQFFGGENNWGTRGTVSDRGDGYKLIKLDGGGYALQNILVSASDKNLGSNIYVDNAGAAGGWTISNTGNGVYTIYNTNPGYLAQGTEQLRKGFAAVALSDVADAAKWYILTKEEAVAQMTGATVDNPVPATFLIKNPGFNRNYSTADWSGGANSNGANENMNTEKYMTSFDVYQTLTGIPNGVYTLNAQAAVTYHDDRAKKPYDGKGAPVIYANEETSDFVEMTVNDQLSSQGAISTAMNNGNYRVKTIIVEVTDGTLKVGAKSDRSDIWAVWDNFELAYLGTEVKAADLKKEIATEAYKSLIAAAREILPETMPAGVLVALDKAINDYTESKVLTAEATFESINAAVEALDKAYNNAKGAVDSSKALMAMYELMENNNVVTAEAYETYMGKFEAYSSQWEAGTLAEAVVNPYALNGWHNNSLDYDDYLLSAWSVGDNKCNNYDTELYINTWSVEGENDGTNFKVPFFEYWTGDDNSLGAKDLVANLKDLEPGVYEVTAWVRARAKNGTDAADATGITFQVNDGDVVDVTEGETVGQFNIAEYVVEAVVEDGNLTVKFSVAGDNNISWLSFQNVKYTKTGDIISTAISEVGEKAAAKTVYNVAGQQLTAPVKGLNIVDGKKIYVK